jgi:hypothetical protein
MMQMSLRNYMTTLAASSCFLLLEQQEPPAEALSQQPYRKKAT